MGDIKPRGEGGGIDILCKLLMGKFSIEPLLKST